MLHRLAFQSSSSALGRYLLRLLQEATIIKRSLKVYLKNKRDSFQRQKKGFQTSLINYNAQQKTFWRGTAG